MSQTNSANSSKFSGIINCTDSDGGANYYVKGVTSSLGVTEEDLCVNSTYQPGLLQEYICPPAQFSDLGIEAITYNCPNGCSDGACIGSHISTPNESEITTPTTDENNVTACTSGCLYQDKCLPYGYRTALSYCSTNSTLTKQMNEGSCINNFECTSGVCMEGLCVSPNAFQQLLDWFKALFGVQ